MPKKVIALLAPGFEEVEAITPVDYLRRAGLEVCVTAAGLDARGKNPAVQGSHGITVLCDASLEGLAEEGRLSASAWDAVVIPGGLPGADNLAADKEAGAFIKEMAAAGKWVCAICAAPARVLAPLGILAGKKFTCYPGMEAEVSGAEWKQDRIVIDGAIITSRGAGTAGEFACAAIGVLVNREAAEKLAKSVLLLSA